MVVVGTRVAVRDAGEEVRAWLRQRAGLAPSRDPQTFESSGGVGYVGREFRVYPYMRVEDAIDFYAALHERWDEAQLAGDLATVGLESFHQVRRLKLVYQRALVLALASAAHPEMLIVENAEEFDEGPARALLQSAVERAPRALVTFAEGTEFDTGWFDRTIEPQALFAGEVAL